MCFREKCTCGLFGHVKANHFHATLLFESARQIRSHLHANNLHRTVLQVVFDNKLFTTDNSSGTTIGAEEICAEGSILLPMLSGYVLVLHFAYLFYRATTSRKRNTLCQTTRACPKTF
eukprot:m.125211 g.125211  ORF g.125211 m.125211 type:complete len:118 (-) comp23454_c0_seq1:54-407(-)